MKSFLCCIGLVAVAVFTGAACGDSDTPGGAAGSGGTGGSGGSGGSGATDGGGDPDGRGASQTEGCVTVYEGDKLPFGGAAPPAYTCNAEKSTRNPTGPNSCRNESDCSMINTPPAGIRATVKECALAHRDKEPMPGVPETERVAKCMVMADANTSCVRMATAMKFMPPGISDACGKCYTEIALCSIAFCLSTCGLDADSLDCAKCQFASGCRLPFERCSGVDRQD
jgi:hypothetical protein